MVSPIADPWAMTNHRKASPPDDATPAARPAARGRRQSALKLPERTAVVSHEIRGPLGVMTALAELLLSRDLADGDRHLVEMIRLAGAHVTGLTDDLLAEASLGADSFRVTPQSFAPEALVRGVVELWSPLMQGGERDLSFRVEAGAPAIVVSDEARIRQILFNLVSNASRATPTGRIEVGLSPGDGPDRFAIWVRDTGHGLPDGFTPGPFLSGAPTGQGTGLGLWISSRIAEALGGCLSLGPRAEGGTEARLELPLVQPVEQDAPVSKRPGRRSAGRRTSEAGPPARRSRRPTAERRSPLAGRRVLVIDDSAVSRMLLEAILVSFEMDVVTAGSGAEAMTAIDLGRFDVVLLDWSLRGESGADVLAGLQAALGPEAPPVIAVSAALRMAAGAPLAGGVEKPFTPRELFTALTNALSGTVRALETA